MSDEEKGDSPKKKQPPERKVVIMGSGDMPPDIAGALGALFNHEGAGSTCQCPRCRADIDMSAPTKDRSKSLRGFAAAMDRGRDFEVGDIVRWKPGLNITRIKSHMIIRKIMTGEDILYSKVNEDYHSPFFNLPLDCIVGIITNEGNFLEYHEDSRRLEKVPEDEQ